MLGRTRRIFDRIGNFDTMRRKEVPPRVCDGASVQVRIRDAEVSEMSMNKFALLFLSLSLFGLQARAELAIEPRAENGVTFVSGGAGDEGVQAIHEIERDYNLRLLFAVQGSGNYLSRVDVKILDQG